MSRYQVKWTDKKGQTYFGTVDNHPSEEPAPGHVFVNDAVLPVYHEVKETDLVDIPVTSNFETYNKKTGEFEGGDEYEQYVRTKFQEAQTRSKSLPEGLQVDKIFHLSVADGRAHYIVTKVNKKTVRVEWRGFGSDPYYDQILGGGGSFPRDRIAMLVKRQEGLAKIFGKSVKKS